MFIIIFSPVLWNCYSVIFFLSFMLCPIFCSNVSLTLELFGTRISFRILSLWNKHPDFRPSSSPTYFNLKKIISIVNMVAEATGNRFHCLETHLIIPLIAVMCPRFPSANLELAKPAVEADRPARQRAGEGRAALPHHIRPEDPSLLRGPTGPDHHLQHRQLRQSHHPVLRTWASRFKPWHWHFVHKQTRLYLVLIACFSCSLYLPKTIW